ncbi:CRISPR-associated protein, TIGR02710 family [Thermosyntropha lipolytica DSM 11003]|uniref:CRISPR-associated protein, TIGR02710 family n=1 Tax=Thermosyntropha lipolytica DSM 11003 TaxID=1123382 RepID=A0A1M5RKF5_9FIRM|nr:TIGR02710 family CRISPR-associated CARF protein [Thermosyntropha lipolytica]SHH26734.1 CRISPR-associated protein, TIGR02710 family [Thermosyntropha lipolytica DSM 11003]
MDWQETEREMLAKYISEWYELERKGEKREAESLYNEKILPLSIKKFCQQHEHYKQKYDLFIATLGGAWAGTAHVISLLAPRQVLLICTEESRRHLDSLYKHIAPVIPLSAVYWEMINDSNDVLQVYQVIKNYCWRRRERIKTLALDFTGGTKTMSAGLILAGTVLGAADFYYLGNEEGAYLNDLRRPRPGSEMLIKVEHPFAVFGDLEAENAQRLAGQYNYHSAASIYKQLMGKVPDPRYFELHYLLCRSYNRWDNLEIKEAGEVIKELINRIRQYRYEDFAPRFVQILPVLEKQAAYLDRLAPIQEKDFHITEALNAEFAVALVMTIYTNALRRERQGKLDMATLLLYRTLEMISQFTLLLNYGLDTAEPEYEKLPMKKEELYEKMAEIYKKAQLSVPAELPDKISLLHGYALLKALDDPLVQNVNIKQISEQSNMRNNTIFAHGFAFIKPAAYEAFKRTVNALLEAFISRQGKCLADELQVFDFINLEGVW